MTAMIGWAAPLHISFNMTSNLIIRVIITILVELILNILCGDCSFLYEQLLEQLGELEWNMVTWKWIRSYLGSLWTLNHLVAYLVSMIVLHSLTVKYLYPNFLQGLKASNKIANGGWTEVNNININNSLTIINPLPNLMKSSALVTYEQTQQKVNWKTMGFLHDIL